MKLEFSPQIFEKQTSYFF